MTIGRVVVSYVICNKNSLYYLTYNPCFKGMEAGKLLETIQFYGYLIRTPFDKQRKKRKPRFNGNAIGNTSLCRQCVLCFVSSFFLFSEKLDIFLFAVNIYYCHDTNICDSILL